MHNHLLFQHATNNTQAALETLTSALKISPKYVLPKMAGHLFTLIKYYLTRNALCKFQRASILHSCDKNQEALEVGCNWPPASQLIQC